MANASLTDRRLRINKSAAAPVFVRDPLLDAADSGSSLLCGVEVYVHVLQSPMTPHARSRLVVSAGRHGFLQGPVVNTA